MISFTVPNFVKPTSGSLCHEMGPAQVCSRKVRTLVLGVMLGVFALTHSGFSDAVPQDEVFREAVTEGYLVNGFFPSESSTAPPRRPDSTAASQQPSPQSGDGDVFEERLGAFSSVSITESVELHQSSQQPSVDSTEGSRDSTDSTDWASSPQTTPQSGRNTGNTQRFFSEATEGSAFEGSADNSDFFTTTHSSTTAEEDFEGSASGSGDQGIDTLFRSTSASPVSTTKGASESSSSDSPQGRALLPPPINPSSTRNLGASPETRNPQPVHESPHSDTDRTPGWIIIVAFIVGVAALVMLCVAIATRDKWNRPNQASQLETKTNPANQQRELEMETFLQKDPPRENGEAEEYTVIQLDDLPDKYSSD